ncbi:MAG: glycosyltransferase [bacterium]|nr:glycosyltransferase [bacterium]
MPDVSPLRPRVAYIVSKFPKLTETFVLYEALALRDQGVDVEIYPLVPHSEQVSHADVASMEDRVHRAAGLSWPILQAGLFWALGSPLRFLKCLVSLARGCGTSPALLMRGIATFPRVLWIAHHMQEAGIEHVHAHFANHPALAARIVHDLTGIQYSFTAHGSDLHRDPRGLRIKVLGSAFTIAVSQYNRRFILERVGNDLSDQVLVLFCGADIARFSPNDRPTTQTGSPLRITCVAALREVKGHTHLLAALEQLKAKGVLFNCHFAGDGPLREALAAEIRKRGLQAHVTLLGSQTKDQIQALLSNSDTIALTSICDSLGRREGIPVSLMEGMAAELPVISSRLSGIPELVEHDVSGLLAEPGDESTLADNLLRLAVDPNLRKRMGQAGRTRVVSDFDLRNNARKLANKIRGSIEASRRA